MASESKTSVATPTVDLLVEIPLTQDQEKYLKKFDEVLPKEKKIVEKGTLTPEERAFLEKNVHQNVDEQGVRVPL